MIKNDYYELLRLAEALQMICDSELLWHLAKADGLLPDDFMFAPLMRVIADGIHDQLTA